MNSDLLTKMKGPYYTFVLIDILPVLQLEFLIPIKALLQLFGFEGITPIVECSHF